MNIIFFGSFQQYSAKILQGLIDFPDIHVSGVVTTPPMPVGRKQIITKTPVHILAEQNDIQVYTPESLVGQPQGIAPTDYFVTAGYGKILPKEWLEYPKLGSLNLHFSLLPAYRGANPAEWAIMCGEKQTGITLMQMSEGLDSGAIIQQEALPISDNDTRETLYDKLYTLGAEKLPGWLTNLHQRADTEVCPYITQPLQSPTPYAALLKRDDGFIPWSTIQSALRGESLKVEDFPSKKLQKAFLFSQKGNFLHRLPRALAGYPSLWTLVQTPKGEKRMKILSFTLNPIPYTLYPELVQIEGQQPASWNQIKNQILS